MSVKDELLNMLEHNKGEYMSGEQIADKLSVSRTAVWKAIRALKEDGYDIKATTNKGYSLAADSDILSRTSIEKYLDHSFGNYDFHIFKCVPSTNDTVRDFALSGASEGLVVLSEEQTSGKGRGNRVFFSPSHTGVYMSILLRPHIKLNEVLYITTAAAVAVARAIEDTSHKSAGIKWVNDVFVDGKKACGILTEAKLSIENGELDYAVLGIGINALAPNGGFPSELKSIATSVYDSADSDIRSKLIAYTLNYFMDYYRDLPSKRFLDDYRKRLFFLGKPISVMKNNEIKEATAIDIDDIFRLRVKYANGEEDLLSSGEISIKL